MKTKNFWILVFVGLIIFVAGILIEFTLSPPYPYGVIVPVIGMLIMYSSTRFKNYKK